jgi:hypothetical protein
VLWRSDRIGQVGLGLPESDTEIVLTTNHGYEPDWLVASADEAAERVRAAGGKVLRETFDTPVGRVAVVADPSRTCSCCSTCPRAATPRTS